MVVKVFKRFCIYLLFLPFCCTLSAQRIKNLSAVRNISSDHYFQFYMDNDFIGGTDYYYTAGMNVELVKPSFRKNPLNKLFFRLPEAKFKYGIALDQYAFTPTHIVYDSILYGDRPYAGCLSINSFRIATNEKRKWRIENSFRIGLIGLPSLCKALQIRLHKSLIPAPQPKGWDNQIKTDLILNYKLNIEKNFIGGKYFLLNGTAGAIAGTLNDKLIGGLNVMMGKMKDPFQSSANSYRKKWEAYLFGSSFFSLVGYDATLQGGVFDNKSPYTLPGSAINRLTLQNQLGIMVNYKRFYLELSETFLSKEFKTGLSHRWGSLGIAFELK